MAENSGDSAGKQRGKPFEKGRSGNPGGRPKSFASLIRERTDDGRELVEFFLALKNGKIITHEHGEPFVDAIASEKVETKDRTDAAKWLADRGWGKAQESVEVSGPDGGGLSVVINRVVRGGQ